MSTLLQRSNEFYNIVFDVGIVLFESVHQFVRTISHMLFSGCLGSICSSTFYDTISYYYMNNNFIGFSYFSYLLSLLIKLILFKREKKRSLYLNHQSIHHCIPTEINQIKWCGGGCDSCEI